MADNSLSKNPNAKGSYLRRTQDITRPLNAVGARQLAAPSSFIYYYLGCEKLAKIIKGLAKGDIADNAFEPNYGTPFPKELLQCAKKIGCAVNPEDARRIYGKPNNSARQLRNSIVHEIGPTNAKNIVDAAPELVPRMRCFLECQRDVVNYIQSLP